MQREVVRRLAEHGGPVYWSAQDVKDALNAGYMELSDATEWNEAHVTFPLTTDRTYYDLRAIVGDTFLGLRPNFDTQTNRWLLASNVREMDARDRRWEMATGEPQRMFTRGLWWLGLWPKIQSEGGTIKQYYVGLPAPMVDDDDVPGFPDTWHYACVDFAMTELWAMDGETRFAMTAWAAYLPAEADLQAWVDTRAGEAAMHGFGDGLRS